MRKSALIAVLVLVCGIAATKSSWALIDGGVSGTVTDDQGIAVSGATVELQKTEGTVIKSIQTNVTGDYTFFPVTLGDYVLSVKVSGYSPYVASVHVASDSTTQADIHLAPPLGAGEMVLNVKAKRHSVQTTQASSSKEVNAKQIEELPQGDNISLPHLLATTTPGVIQGPFGQTFIRGNHANIQYQIDGVQLPDSQSGAFGDAFTPRNIDHMEVITGGIPAEYGDRLAAVVNIVTKSGPETPTGAAELNYGSYNTFSPWAVIGGSNESGSLHYFLSGQYSRTDRGLDTPQPESETAQDNGGTDAIHDSSNSNNQFAKIDWLPNNTDKVTIIGFNSYNFYQIPNLPSSFNPSDPFFQAGFSDQFGNGGDPTATTFTWTPPNTNDTQAEDDAYAELVWKHSFDDHTFLQTAPYYKYSLVHITNDPTNDLASTTLIPLANPASLAEDRHVNNFGVKSDFTDRINDRNLFKAGYQVQESRATGSVDVIEGSNTGGTFGNVTGATQTSSSDSSPSIGYTESVYVQDDFTITKKLVLNVGLRFDAIQDHFNGTEEGDVTSADNMVQPRIGLNYFVGENTKIHAFYGKLFQPAPLENLRDTFVDLGVGNSLAFYDIKAEKDDYYELGIAQQWGSQVLGLNTYYKNATNMLDDTELLNTSVAEAYNYAKGYAYGVEFSLQGKIDDNWSDYANYSYEIAKGEGASGGLFALPAGTVIPQGYLFLDHVQVHTANSGITYSKDNIRWTTQGLFGSGLRTGQDNSLSLPSHFTMDTSVGYDFHGDNWLTKVKVSGDMINIFNNVYPITIANGFNGSHYAAGREFFIHLTKEL